MSRAKSWSQWLHYPHVSVMPLRSQCWDYCWKEIFYRLLCQEPAGWEQNWMPSSKLVPPKKELLSTLQGFAIWQYWDCMHIHMLWMVRRNKTWDYRKNAWRRIKYCFRDSKIFFYIVMHCVMGIYLFSKCMDCFNFYLILSLNWSSQMRFFSLFLYLLML